jgi:hypothetical protein
MMLRVSRYFIFKGEMQVKRTKQVVRCDKRKINRTLKRNKDELPYVTTVHRCGILTTIQVTLTEKSQTIY